MFSEQDLKQIENKGIELSRIEKQIEYFKSGFPFIKLLAPAVPGSGIHKLSVADADEMADFYDKASLELTKLKFVPASGAASRMFKYLHEFCANPPAGEEEYKKVLADDGFDTVGHFLKNLRKFAFYPELEKLVKEKFPSFDGNPDREQAVALVELLLTDKGMNYASLPKGLLKFHVYNDECRKSFEEHLVEGALYAKEKDGKVSIHLTVSHDHADMFIEEMSLEAANYAELFEVEYELNFSVQKPSTDTISVDLENRPFRNDDNSILFRPGGHGALIENLNDIKGDIIFVKNIDNIVPDRLKDETVKYKKVIGAFLLKMVDKVHGFLHLLDGDHSADLISQIEDFLLNELQLKLPEDYNEYPIEKKVPLLRQYLDRPIRVCGMVKNEGEPGGGPFWVRNSDGKRSLQIVEKSQINMDDDEQKQILSGSTHFNPVDLVCWKKKPNGEYYDLTEFVDPETGFIAMKSKDGKDLKALELPGLWNGAMANWITVFVEVPIITFNPVKTVNDLLRPQHQ